MFLRGIVSKLSKPYSIVWIFFAIKNWLLGYILNKLCCRFYTIEIVIIDSVSWKVAWQILSWGWNNVKIFNHVLIYAHSRWLIQLYLFLLQIFIQKRIGTFYSMLWKHFLQTAFISFALLCSISRIIDKRHHWWDVLAGSIFGAILGILTVSNITFTWFCAPKMMKYIILEK